MFPSNGPPRLSPMVAVSTDGADVRAGQQARAIVVAEGRGGRGGGPIGARADGDMISIDVDARTPRPPRSTPPKSTRAGGAAAAARAVGGRCCRSLRGGRSPPLGAGATLGAGAAAE